MNIILGSSAYADEYVVVGESALERDPDRVVGIEIEGHANGFSTGDVAIVEMTEQPPLLLVRCPDDSLKLHRIHDAIGVVIGKL